MDSPSEPSPRGDRAAIFGPFLFAALFLVVTAVIFTVTFRTSSPGEAPTTAMTFTAMPTTPPPAYPLTRRTDDADTYFGTRVADPYRWLESDDSPEEQAWLRDENTVTRRYLDALPGRAALEKRYTQLIRIETISTPARAGSRLFYMQRRAEQDKAVLYWQAVGEQAGAGGHVLIDPNALPGGINASLGDWVPTLDGRLLAYTLKPNNADEATLYVKDIATGKDLPGEVITGAKYASPSWMPDGSGFVYTHLPPADPKHPEDRPGLAVVKYHKLGTDAKADPVLHPATGDPTKFVGGGISRDGKWIFFEQQNGWDKNDIYYQPLHGAPTAALARHWEPIVVGQPFLYSIQTWQDEAYIVTNEGAPRFRVFKVAMSDPARANWKEIVPQFPQTVIGGASIIGGRLVLDEMENVASRVEIRDLEGHPIRQLELPGLGSVGLSGEPDHDEIYYSFVNFTQPPEIFQASVAGPGQKLWARIKVPVDPSPYVVEQKFFTSKDGTRVPMFLVHRRDILLDGSTPFLIYGYGGFGLSQTPFFSPGFYPWLEAGGGYALVNLRGGGEFGEQWHQDGMLLKKQNVFDDCIGAAESLIANGYTRPERLALRGGSNGGLLVGAVMTQRPELFRAVVCEVPLLDMIRYVKFGSGKTWIPEYGTPDDEAQFHALYAYSPYHHVKPGTVYPAVLMCSAANDDRVAPLHARKMVAALQAAGSPRPVLLRVEMQSGHGGGDQVKKLIPYATDIWGFLIHELGAQTPGSDKKSAVSH